MFLYMVLFIINMIDILNIINYITSLFNKVAVSLFILFFGFVFAKLTQKISRFIIYELKIKKFLKIGFKFNINVEEIVSKSLYYIIFLITMYLSLKNLEIELIGIILFLLLLIIIFTLSIIFDIKDLILNFFYGLTLKNKLKKGQKISTKILDGKIIKKKSTGIIISEKNDRLYIPNIFLKEGFLIKK